MKYTSLEQRLAHGYLEMLPSFVPDKNAPVSVSDQNRFYQLIKGIYEMALGEPLLFVPSLHEDDTYPTRIKKAYRKPKLIEEMKKFTKAVNGLMQTMYGLGQVQAVKCNRRQAAILAKLGIDGFTTLPDAWRWMATKDGANLSAFSHCLFDDDYPYTSELYADLLGAPAFKKLENWMLGQGYQRYDKYDITDSDCDLSLSIVNPRWSGEPPRGGFEYKIKHTGISARFDYYVRVPQVFGLCIPGGLKDYLNAFAVMSTTLQSFVIHRTKKCDNCRYCVHTDKTATRPPAFIPVEYENQTHRLCPYFPGYSYSWSSIDDGLADQLIEFLSFMDGFLSGKAITT